MGSSDFLREGLFVFGWNERTRPEERGYKFVGSDLAPLSWIDFSGGVWGAALALLASVHLHFAGFSQMHPRLSLVEDVG